MTIAKRKLDAILTHTKPTNERRLFKASKLKTPTRISWRPFDIPIWDQREMGACTGNGLGWAHDFLRVKVLRENHPDRPVSEIIKMVKNSSRLFIYFAERALEGTIHEDAGASIPDGIEVLTKLGVCPEKLWPYEEARLYKKPTEVCYREALTHRNVNPFYLSTIEEIEQCLADGFPVVFGQDLYESFDNIGSDGIVPIPKPGERSVGGHCMGFCGYDRDKNGKRYFETRQSWGEDYGDNGYIWTPYELVESNQISDCWTFRL